MRGPTPAPILLALALGAIGAAGGEVSLLADGAYGEALGLVYDGAFHAAEERLATLAAQNPDDPVAPYLQGLALEWRLEQDPARHALDAGLLALADRAIALAETRRGGESARALMARGAAHGLKSRFYLFRGERRAAAREAVRMRADLLAVHAAGPGVGDLDFGLGLYDYYAETLPRFYRLLRPIVGVPGGNRERGLEAIARAARGPCLFHESEATVQMFEIQSYFERRPDRALPWIRKMWGRYPGWPLWGLKLAELLRDPLGLFVESAAVAREILTTAELRRHVNYQPVVASMARVALGEALLLDLRFAEAREVLTPALAGDPQAAWVGPKAELLTARSQEAEGDREAALEHYRRAAGGADPAIATRARDALEHSLPEGEVRAAPFLARARRLREAGRDDDAEEECGRAFAAHPPGAEGRLCAARASLHAGRPVAARALAAEIADRGRPPWLQPAARLVIAEAYAREGKRAAAVRAYKEVWEHPLGRPALRKEAAEAIRRLDPSAPPLPEPRFER